MSETTPPKKDLTPWQGMELVWDIGFAIALPTVLFALGGRWLDQRWGTSPLFLILGLFLSLVVVTVIVMKKGKDIAKRLS